MGTSRRASIVVAVVLCFVGGALAQGDPAFENQVFVLVNQVRAQNGLAALCLNSKLQRAAELHTTDQAVHSTMSHTGSDGSNPGARVTRQNYDWNSVAENVAAGQRTPAEVMNSWMNSPGHRANILSGNTMIGVGFQNYYWTQVFARSSTETCDMPNGINGALTGGGGGGGGGGVYSGAVYGGGGGGGSNGGAIAGGVICALVVVGAVAGLAYYNHTHNGIVVSNIKRGWAKVSGGGGSGSRTVTTTKKTFTSESTTTLSEVKVVANPVHGTTPPPSRSKPQSPAPGRAQSPAPPRPAPPTHHSPNSPAPPRPSSPATKPAAYGGKAPPRAPYNR